MACSGGVRQSDEIDDFACNSGSVDNFNVSDRRGRSLTPSKSRRPWSARDRADHPAAGSNNASPPDLFGNGLGVAAATVSRSARGRPVATLHLRHLNPLPHDLGAILRSYDRVIVPEMNLGQLAMILRARYLVDCESYSRVRGLPISLSELAEDLIAIIDGKDGR